MSMMEQEIKEMIIEVLNLEDISPEEIKSDEPLFGEGLGLDSIDALELGVAIKKRYNITLDSSNNEIRNHFSSVSALAKFIESQKK
ncbi:phosphopantetheine-binding protein [Francisella frigiditurris]|uniref:Phosphopantetheine attachment site family protein n=1 Tax=Francisella frigiditurris TaxID=1542390 RepID=A0A1J0KUN2_9GAMM|nr:phosphopantetheine-binding protein [Francisella frigiditurris]APC97520.1 phosphopantetheine attachment site family protein [Francisella frigiditurris]